MIIQKLKITDDEADGIGHRSTIVVDLTVKFKLVALG